MALKIASQDPLTAASYCEYRLNHKWITHCHEDVAQVASQNHPDEAMEICNGFNSNDEYHKNHYRQCIDYVLINILQNHPDKYIDLCGEQILLTCMNSLEQEFLGNNALE